MPPIDGNADINEAGVLALWGPLGAKKTRRQLGRSVQLSGVGGKTRAEVLVFTGADTAEGPSGLDVGDALASVCTITTAIIDRTGIPPDEPTPVIEGIIDWGTDGTSASARFDWRNGGNIVAGGSSFKVSAEAVLIDRGHVIDVAAFISYYPIRCCEARLTRVVLESPTIFEIPAMAHAVLPMVDDNNGATLQFTSDLAGLTPLFGPYTYAAGSSLIALPLKVPPGARSVIVTTTAATLLPVVFELSL